MKVVIIGAGVGGMATANLLAKQGHKVTVIEGRDQLGGRMGLLQDKGFRFDTGPSWYLMPEVYDRYYQLLGTRAKTELDLKKLTPAYQVFFEDREKPITITGQEKKDARLFESEEPGAGASLNKYLDSAESIYASAQKHFLYTTFDSIRELLNPTLVRQALPIASKSGRSMHSLVKRYFKNPQLQQILEYPAVFLGSSPYSAPALYSLMSYLDFRQGVFYPQGGMFTITTSMERLGKKFGVRYLMNSPVSKIVVRDGQARGVKLTSGKIIDADIVISNADMHFTQTSLLPKNYQDYPAAYWKKREAGPSALLVYLGVKGSLPELQHHNLFFAKDWKTNFKQIFKDRQIPKPASIYVCKPSATDPSVAPKGSENVFVLVPLPANKPLSAKQVDALAMQYLDQIADQAGIVDLHSRIVYKKCFGPGDFSSEFNSWQGTALGLSHQLRQSAMFRPKITSRKVRGLYYVGANVQPGIGVPMCLISAELVAAQIAKDKHVAA